MNDKKKKVAKEAAKALGVTGASAAIGAAALDPWKTFDMLDGLGQDGSPLQEHMIDTLYNSFYKESPYEKIEENPNIGVGLNAVASGLGGLAAYGLLKGSVKGLKKLDDKMFQRKVALHNATNNIKVNNS